MIINMEQIKIQNNLREFRLKAGLKQTDVVKALGFKSTDRISRWEAGLTYHHVRNLFKMAELYGVRAEELFVRNYILPSMES